MLRHCWLQDPAAEFLAREQELLWSWRQSFEVGSTHSGLKTVAISPLQSKYMRDFT